MKWMVVDKRNSMALYGVGCKTLLFSTKEIATEVALQFFDNEEDFIIVSLYN